jgi:biotin carboxyl carrier protein
VLVQPGQEVAAREALVVLEAMKMETPVSAPFAGRVSAVHVEEGAPVAAGTLLVELDA